LSHPYSPPRRRRRWPYILAAGLAGLAGLVWFAPVIVARTGLKDQLLRSATSDIKGTVTVQSMSLGWMSPVELRGVTLVDESGSEVIRVERIASERTLAALIGNKHDFGRFTAESPNATIVCHERETNLETVLAHYLTPAESKASPRSGISFIWTKGTVTIRDALSNQSRTVTDVEGETSIPSSTSEPVLLRMTGLIAETSGRIDLTGTIGVNGALSATLEKLPLNMIGWYARRYEPGLSAEGTATATANVEWTGEGGKGTGRIEGRDISLGAARLGPDRIRSGTIDVPLTFHVVGTTLTVEQCSATTDVGKASLTGTFDLSEPAERWLSRPGVRANADLDLAKLGTMLPNALHIRDGTRITDGRLQFDVANEASSLEPSWRGTASATTIRAMRNGQTIVWDQPIRCEFAGRLNAMNQPHFDKLQIASDFIGLNFRGSLDSFEAAANLDLDRLTSHLADFVNLNGVRLAGRAAVQAWNRPDPSGTMVLACKVNVERFLFRDGTRSEWSEPALTIDATADAKRDRGAFRMERVTAKLTSGNDSARLVLTEPIPDLFRAKTGKATVDVSGDLGRWRTRLAGFVGIPRNWTIAGSGRLSSVLALTEHGIMAERNDGELTNLRFRGLGLQLDDPRLKVSAGAVQWEHKTGNLLGTQLALTGDSVAADCKRLSVRDFDRPVPSFDGTVVIRAIRLSKIANTFGLASDPRGSDAVDGIGKGTIQCTTANGAFGFDANLTVESFRYGSAQRPTWTEPSIGLIATGRYEPSRDGLDFTLAQIVTNGFRINGKGSVDRWTTTGDVDVSGTIDYDLAKIEPFIKEYLGRNGSLAGKDSRPFRITGRLESGADQMTVLWGGLRGDASVGWQSARAFGFDIGPADLKANLEKGTMAFQPVTATMGTGRLSVHPSLKLNVAYDLSFAKGRIIDKARLTPAVCADAIGFALPAIAKSSDAEGLISVDLDESRIPLADYTKMAAKGRLLMHTVTLTPGPVIREILAVSGVQEPKFTLATEQIVPVWIENGRVHHRDFVLTAKSFSIRTNGSVGFDGTLQLNCEVPIPAKLLDQAFKNTPRIREAMAKRTIAITIGGTIDRPKLDPRAFQANVQKLIGDATKDAAADLLKQELDKGLDRFLPKPPAKKP
jgi:translocation and assembly module TamB